MGNETAAELADASACACQNIDHEVSAAIEAAHYVAGARKRLITFSNATVLTAFKLLGQCLGNDCPVHSDTESERARTRLVERLGEGRETSRVRSDLTVRGDDVDVLRIVHDGYPFGALVVMLHDDAWGYCQAYEVVVGYSPSDGSICDYVPLMVGPLYEES